MVIHDYSEFLFDAHLKCNGYSTERQYWWLKLFIVRPVFLFYFTNYKLLKFFIEINNHSFALTVKLILKEKVCEGIQQIFCLISPLFLGYALIYV